MPPADPDDGPRRADSYEHPDGTREVVFEVADGRVLTVREYPDRETFVDGVADAAYAGRHEGVADLPDVEAFAGGDEVGDEPGDGPSASDDGASTSDDGASASDDGASASDDERG